MATPDMDVIKEIPGYKVILKAVLKSQIQQLVETLASHTDEESVILTASVSDGTLSHLGSDSGKNFLQDHEDIKSQFLGFCLKRFHKKKQEQEREEELKKMSFSQPQFSGPNYGGRFPSPRQNIHPVRLSKASPGARGPGVRHEPYHMPRPRKSLDMTPTNQQSPSPSHTLTSSPATNQIIKIEPLDADSNQSSDNVNKSSTSRPTSPSHAQNSAENQNNSNISTNNDASDLPPTDAQPPGGLGLDSDFSNLISSESLVNPSTSGAQTSDLDPNVNVKIEAISEGDMELEITGVEPGNTSIGSQDTSWAQDMSNMGYDPSGVTGNQADLQGAGGEGYKSLQRASNARVCKICGAFLKNQRVLREHERRHESTGRYTCSCCGKLYFSKTDFMRHKVFKHGLAKTHKCDTCKKTYATSTDLKRHQKRHEKDGGAFKCDICGRGFFSKSNLNDHRNKHTGKNSHVCVKCGRSFRYSSNLIRHAKKCKRGDN